MLTVRSFFEEWMTIRDRSGRYKRTTLVRDREVITHHILPTLGDRLLTDLKPAELHSLYSRLGSEVNPQTGKPKTHISANQAANVLGVSWGWLFELVRRGKIPATRRGQWLIPRDALPGIRHPRSRRCDQHHQRVGRG
ncbi:MAG: helix-turn-helix domain-containing protein [bacterium]